MKFVWLFILVVFFSSCSRHHVASRSGGKKGIFTSHFNKILKSHDNDYKLRMAEQYYVKKSYSKAQQIYEDVMPYYRTSDQKIYEDIFYKYAYCAWYQHDYLNAENIFQKFLEDFPNSARAEEVDFMRADCYFKQSPRVELDQTSTVKAMGMMQTFINTHPGSTRIKEANEIIDICRKKLETKDYQSAQLYYDLGQFRAAGVSFTTLLNNYPESENADQYKLMIIKSYFRYAEMSIDEKKKERFEKVIDECNDFTDRFPDSKLKKEAEHYLNLSQTNIKNLNNEQVKTST